MRVLSSALYCTVWPYIFCTFRSEMFFFRSITRKLELIMAQIDDLNTAIATLTTDVNTLIAATKPADLTAAIAAVNTVDATVKAATPAA